METPMVVDCQNEIAWKQVVKAAKRKIKKSNPSQINSRMKLVFFICCVFNISHKQNLFAQYQMR